MEQNLRLLTPTEVKAIKRDISKLLKKAREHEGLTQHELSKKLNISQSKLSKLECSKPLIDLLTLTELSGFYNKPITAFLPKALKTYYEVVNRES